MTPTQEFLGQTTARANIRPRRLAYLVKAGDLAALRESIEYATSEWGGMGHPIIRVHANGRAPWLALCDELSPEAFIDFSQISKRFRERIQDRFGVPVLLPQELSAANEPGVHSLVALPPDSLPGRVVPLASDDLASQAALGIVRESELDQWTATGAQFHPSVSPQGDFIAQLDLSTPLGIGTRNFPGYEITNAWPDTIIIQVVSRHSPAQVVRFWNFRAMAVPIWGLERVILCSPQAINAPVAARLRDLCMRKVPTVPDVFLLGSDKKLLREIGTLLGFEESDSPKIRTSLAATGPRDFEKEPLTFMANVRPPLAQRRLGGKRRDLSFPVTRPRTSVRIDSPVEFRPSWGGHIRLDLQDAQQFT